MRALIMAWLNTSETDRRALFQRMDTWSGMAKENAQTAQQRFQKFLGMPRTDRFDQSCPSVRFVLDAQHEPDLLARSGQVEALRRMTRALCEQPGPLPEVVQVEVRLPDQAWVNRLERGVRKGNAIALSSGLVNALKHRALRFATGVTGQIHPVVLEPVGLDAPGKIRLAVNLSGLEKDDLLKFASFMNRHWGK